MILTLLMMVVSSLLSLVFVYMAVTEQDLLKAVAFSAGQSICYAILLQAMAATDIVMTYVAVSVGLYSALLVFVLSKTERFEEMGR
ncbi:MAG: hydrogenase subunit MbhD domain-containing protein [Desulfurococcaceae archaeon]